MQRAEEQNAYILGMGDYDDFASASERHALNLSKENLHDTSKRWIDDICKDRAYDFAKEWEPFKGKIIGLIEGNHHYNFTSGVTSTQLMAQHLGCKYLGVSSFIRLQFDHLHSGRSISLDIFAHHGLGGGRRTGSSINRVEDMERVADADIYLMGHDHHKWVVFSSKLRLSHGNKSMLLKQHKILLGRTGSYQKGYEDGKSNFPSGSAMPPAELGSISIYLTPLRKRIKDDNGIHEDSIIDIEARL